MSTSKRSKGQILFSSQAPTPCPKCQKPFSQCQCRRVTVQIGDGIVRIRRESKGRKGKGVCVIEGLPLVGKDLQDLCKTLKKKCGTGGTVKNNLIEIQGDHREALQKEIAALGYKVKLAGG